MTTTRPTPRASSPAAVPASLAEPTLRGPEVDSHLDVALAVAAGIADAGIAVRAAATAIGLDFVPLTWQPFELAVGADDLDAASPLLDALSRPEVRSHAAALGGYDLEGAGAVRALE